LSEVPLYSLMSEVPLYSLAIGAPQKRGALFQLELLQAESGLIALEAIQAESREARRGVRGQRMPSPRPWKMIRYFHSTVRNPS